MIKPLSIFLLVAMAAGGCMETRVIRDNSVAAQFARLPGGHVTINDPKYQTNKPKPGPAASAQGNVPLPSGNNNPFANAVWTTNLRVTAPSSAGTTLVPGAHAPENPLVGSQPGSVAPPTALPPALPAAPGSNSPPTPSAPGSSVPSDPPVADPIPRP